MREADPVVASAQQLESGLGRTGGPRRTRRHPTRCGHWRAVGRREDLLRERRAHAEESQSGGEPELRLLRCAHRYRPCSRRSRDPRHRSPDAPATCHAVCGPGLAGEREWRRLHGGIQRAQRRSAAVKSLRVKLHGVRRRTANPSGATRWRFDARVAIGAQLGPQTSGRCQYPVMNQMTIGGIARSRTRRGSCGDHGQVGSRTIKSRTSSDLQARSLTSCPDSSDAPIRRYSSS